MTSFTQKSLFICIALVVATSSYWLLSSYAVNTIARVVMVGVFPADAEVELRVKNRWGAERVEKIDLPAADGSPKRVGSSRLNFSSRDLIIEFSVPKIGPEPQYVNLHNVQIERPYSYDLFIGHNRLRSRFSSGDYADSESQILKVDQATGKATLTLSEPFVAVWSLLYLALAAFFGFAAFLILSSTAWSELPAIKDMGLGNKISTAHEFDTVNGLRGLAALLVLFSHTAPGFFSIQLGLCLLFLFSGFLLSKPFVLDPDKIFNGDTIRKFLIKRIRRILPVYYFFVFITYVVTFQFDTALRHFLFVQAEGHLWPMTQIFTFYMLLPLVLLLTCLSYRVHRLLPVLALAAAIYLWLIYGTSWTPFYNGAFSHEFYLQAFLMGVLGAYLQYDLIRKWPAFQSLFIRHKTVIALLSAALLILTIAWSAPVTPPAFIQYYISQFYVKCILCLLIILLAINFEASWFNRIVSNWLFRSVGVIGFSFYILHGLGMQIVLTVQSNLFGVVNPDERSWAFMLATFVITYLMSVISYSWIERPFFGYREPARLPTRA